MRIRDISVGFQVKGVIVQLDELVAQIRSDQEKRSHSKSDESLAFSIFYATAAGHGQSTSGLNGQFVHSQLLIDCLIRMKSTSTDKNELISLCKDEYKGNKTELKIVREFEQDYSLDRALRWYTRQCLL